jgi:hypothetical protein
VVLASVCVCGVMEPYVSYSSWRMWGTVPSRRPVSSSMRSARHSSSIAVLICWIIVCSMRLHYLNMARLSACCWRASAIWCAVALLSSGRTGRPGRTKGTPGETRSYASALLTKPRCPWVPLPRVERTDFPFALHSLSSLARLV